MSTEEMQNSNQLQEQIKHILSGNVEGFEERVHEWPGGEPWDRFPKKIAMRYDGGEKYFTLIRDGERYFTYPTDMLLGKIAVEGVSFLNIYDCLAKADFPGLERTMGQMPGNPNQIVDNLIKTQ